MHDPEDIDGGQDAGHHSLGNRENQAAPGSHRHLLDVTITGSKTGASPLTLSLLAALVTLGAQDGTT